MKEAAALLMKKAWKTKNNIPSEGDIFLSWVSFLGIDILTNK